jgi:hypothetical protein
MRLIEMTDFADMLGRVGELEGDRPCNAGMLETGGP